MLIAIGLARRSYGQWHLQRLVSGMIVVASLTIITAMMIGVIIIGGFYAAYFAFVYYGWEPQNALILIGAMAVLAITVFVVIIAKCLRRLREMPAKLLATLPVVARVNEAFDGFLDGLVTEKTR